MHRNLKIIFALVLFLNILTNEKSFSQRSSALSAEAWVDSVFASLNEEEKIAQLMVVRLSSINTQTREITFYDKEVEDAIRRFNIGGICLFQGGPVRQTNLVNQFQQIAKTPILIAIDGENGVGMRLDSVKGLPRQMMLGAVQDSTIIYQYGRWVGEQCKRMGIHVNYAPVVDVNNNPNNPVINDRSFGEDKVKVAQHGIMYMKGMQDVGIMACAKHFPGHGDVEVDSHFDLPVINKDRSQLDSLELYPFREMFRAGVGSVMIAHLYIPSIDNSPNRATSISYNNVTKLMREELGYQGLTFTDALEMKGVSKYYPDGAASVESLIAGNDMLCLPGDVASTIKKIREAVRKKKLSWDAIDSHVKKVLYAKYRLGLNQWIPANTQMLAEDLNKKTNEIRKLVAENAITVLRNESKSAFPIKPSQNIRVAYLGLGINDDNAFAKRMRSDYNADVFYFDYKQSTVRVASLVELLRKRYDAIIVGLHNYARFPARNFNISEAAVELIKRIDAVVPTTTFVFGNPYAIKNFCNIRNIVACYEDEQITQLAAADILNGNISAVGKLPVTVCEGLRYGAGINTSPLANIQSDAAGVRDNKLRIIDSLANDAIKQKATPGCVVLVAKDGKIVYHKAFGHFTYDSSEAVNVESIYDMASVTKICATTLAVMKLYDQGKLDLHKRLGDYLEWVKRSDKENLLIEDILLHQARLKAWIPFYRETIDTSSGNPFNNIYAKNASDPNMIRVADSVYMRRAWRDTMYSRILQSPLEKPGRYVYSDNDFIFLGMIVEAITGMSLDEYVMKEFYMPLGLVTPGFKPRSRFDVRRIAPTEKEKYFRQQLIRGDVHDPGAAMFGGVSGHAGLFSDAYDIAVIMQMLVNKGTLNGKRFLSDTTISVFTSYNSSISRRGLGFDKPEKDNLLRKEPYPCLSASPQTFGHTGFTGTCAWADPKENFIFVFLSNRVYPDVSTKLLQMNVRGKMHEAAYSAFK
jgi:beta-N-acetylhexosaminidase